MSQFTFAVTLMSDLNSQVATVFVREMAHQLREGLEKILHCLRQLNEEQVWWRPTPAQNSIANLMLHLEGNVRQWIVSGVGANPTYEIGRTSSLKLVPLKKANFLSVYQTPLVAQSR